MTAVCRTLLCAMCLAFAGGVGETFPAVLRAAEPEWIWASDSPAAKEVAQFRKQFRVGGPVKSATLGVAGDDEVAVFLNGQPVVRRHGSWREPMFVGVSEQLKSGDNVLAVRGANQSSAAAVVLQLEIELADGQRQSVVTDATWRSSKSAGRGWQEAGYDDAQWPAAHSFGKVGVAPWGKLSLDIASQPKPVATLPERFALAPGFRVELLYSVPGTEQGSWVSLAVDPRGRLIVSDQAGALYRVEVGPTPAHTKVERLRVGIGQAHGLLYAFDSLYVTVNGNAAQGSGLYRVRDTDGDDQFDSVQLLRRIEGGGEHGPHAVVLGPDGQSLYVAGGNHTKLPQPERSLVPRNWQEDQLLPRMWDAGGHAVGILAPGGWICRTDPEGREWELVSSGYRNEYDIAFNPSGDLFTYDSDMEWDIGSPWYRPTRVCHATSGSEFGWRSGSGKWPEYYADSLPAAVDIGPGSPTGITFGTGARFPAKYQQALFICDWSYGNIYAVHLTPDGASYRGEFERFATAAPLPATDIVIHPGDGAMYFTTGGRRTQSGLYRITYVGEEAATPLTEGTVAGGTTTNAARELRRQLEAFHGRVDPQAVAVAWPHLAHEDRFVRYAARIAIEHQPVETWQDRALAERRPLALALATIALARCGDAALQPRLLAALAEVEPRSRSEQEQLHLLRATSLVLIRGGAPDAAARQALLARWDGLFPTVSPRLNRELARLLIYLEAPQVVARCLDRMAEATTQEDAIHYAFALRTLKSGWTRAERETYFRWFADTARYRGGNSFAGFLRNAKTEAVALLDADDKAALATILEAAPSPADPTTEGPPRPFVREWTLPELATGIDDSLKGRDFAKGRAAFAAAICFKCHRFAGEGGIIGPDITGVGNRFTNQYLLESIIEPSKTVSDQYQATSFVLADGRTVVGKVANLNGDSLMVITNMLEPGNLTNVDRRQIEEQSPSPVSLMPTGLLNTFTREEILDLLAYLRSGGNPDHEVWR